MNIPDTFKGLQGGYGVVAQITPTELVAAMVTTTTDYRDVYGWTQGQQSSSFLNQDEQLPSGIRVGGGFTTIPHCDLGEADTYYETAQAHPVFFGVDTGRMSLIKSANAALIGAAVAAVPWYPYLRDKGKYGYHGSVQVNTGNHDSTQDTVVNLDDTIDMDSSYRPDGLVGDKRIIVVGTTGKWSSGQTLTLQGNGGTLSTMSQGSAEMWKLRTATQNDDETWTLSWELVNGQKLFLFNVAPNTEYWRAEMDKLTSGGDPVVAVKIASTTGVKQPWTLTSDAPPDATNHDGGYLAVDLADGESFRLTAKESDNAATDSMIVSCPAGTQTFSLLDGNCLVSCSSKGIRVTHNASGVPSYTVTTDVWMLDA